MSMPASITNVALFFKPTLCIKSEVENPYSAPALNRGLSHLLTATLFVVCAASLTSIPILVQNTGGSL